jgi:adenylate cyclase
MQAVAGFGERMRASGGPGFEIGAGIDYGEIVAGNLGSERRLEYTVIGEPVNNVAWLAAAAQPMEILVTERAWGSLDAQIPVREVRRIVSKGGAPEQTVYSVDWAPMVN